MPLSRKVFRSTCASGSCSSRWTLRRSMRYGVSQWPSTMMARLWTSFAEVVVNALDLSHQLFDVVEEEFRLAEELVLEAARASHRDGDRNAMRGEDVVRRVAHRQRARRVAADALQRGAKDLRRRLGDLRVALRR